MSTENGDVMLTIQVIHREGFATRVEAVDSNNTLVAELVGVGIAKCLRDIVPEIEGWAVNEVFRYRFDSAINIRCQRDE